MASGIIFAASFYGFYIVVGMVDLVFETTCLLLRLLTPIEFLLASQRFIGGAFLLVIGTSLFITSPSLIPVKLLFVTLLHCAGLQISSANSSQKYLPVSGETRLAATDARKLITLKSTNVLLAFLCVFCVPHGIAVMKQRVFGYEFGESWHAGMDVSYVDIAALLWVLTLALRAQVLGGRETSFGAGFLTSGVALAVYFWLTLGVDNAYVAKFIIGVCLCVAIVTNLLSEYSSNL
ncbi:hypothetical protein BC830DRAFT_315628 [Chytriomyces sp. MP71]|nr:hypothetical protein BC830DRAFT_315628 [Chytriomyces sp. MP71]